MWCRKSHVPTEWQGKKEDYVMAVKHKQFVFIIVVTDQKQVNEWGK